MYLIGPLMFFMVSEDYVSYLQRWQETQDEKEKNTSTKSVSILSDAPDICNKFFSSY